MSAVDDRLRVWLVTVGEPLPSAADCNPRLLRTGTLAQRLRDAGHEVTWWTSTFDHARKRQRHPRDANVEWGGVTIRMLKSVGYRSNLSLLRFLEHAGVARKFRRQVRAMPRPDIVLVALPTVELAREAVRYGRRADVPVLVDVRDLWPDALVELLPRPLRGLGRIALGKLFDHARYALANSNGIVGISQGYLDWGLRYAGRPRRATDALVPLGYHAAPASPEGLAAAARRLAGLGVDESRRICWYVGSFGRQYDLAPILGAARRFQAEGRTDVQFVISGAGDRAREWRDLADGTESVIFTGWIGGDEINWLRARAAVGFQPYAAGAPQGLANKLFEYLSAGIPVLSSLEGECRQLLEAEGCGRTFMAGSVDSCYAELSGMLADESDRAAMGERGRRLFATRFDTSLVFDRLVAHLEMVARAVAIPVPRAPADAGARDRVLR